MLFDFTSDGARILAATTARRLAVIDVERGEQVMSYDNCAFNGRDRAGLAVDPLCPNMAVCSCINGKGLTLFDLRMPLPLDFVYDLHTAVIRDITFIHSSWPFVRNQQGAVLSLSSDGVSKVTTLDGRYLHCFEVGHNANSIALTPETYGTGGEDGFSVRL
ncbi:WD_REPEATS_REGION domain-containing protein [Caerostris extrusa]|uniref:WD_REPEATS_REGION domain-containing protein n=1 Tax=Caerostris extrusa TaxID=172846 RepID=A0AAV4PEH2_CAEEX|nr:WD_REPEATS_REGION domain-containing protein [Caerostris extrusa]